MRERERTCQRERERELVIGGLSEIERCKLSRRVVLVARRDSNVCHTAMCTVTERKVS